MTIVPATSDGGSNKPNSDYRKGQLVIDIPQTKKGDTDGHCGGTSAHPTKGGSRGFVYYFTSESYSSGCSHSVPSPSISMIPSTRILLKTLLKALILILIKLWKLSASFMVLVFLAAWFYGGFLPYFLFITGLLSKFMLLGNQN